MGWVCCLRTTSIPERQFNPEVKLLSAAFPELALAQCGLWKKVHVLPPGDISGAFVPQSVSNKDGQLLDVDIVLNEVFEEGAVLQVEYSKGPSAFQARYKLDFIPLNPLPSSG